MKLTCGVDCEEVARFLPLLEKDSFFRRVFTERELAHIRASGHPEETMAGIFCAKEAIAKALRRGFFGLLPQEISVEWGDHGAPQAVLLGSAKEQYGALQLSLSISHTGRTAVAVCTALDPEA